MPEDKDRPWGIERAPCSRRPDGS